MSAVILKVMLLALVRDRVALAMSFAVPIVFFVIFASIFTAGDSVRFKVAVADHGASVASSDRLHEVLGFGDFIRLETATPDAVRRSVKRGRADVGLILKPAGADAPEFIIVGDPVRSLATKLLAGHLRQVQVRALFEGAMDDAPELLPPALTRAISDGDAAFYAQESVVGPSVSLNKVAYYAGAVAVLFLLFSTVHGAITLLEENELGVLDRILLGPGSTVVLVNGKFLYLVVQGFVQVGVIFIVAWLLHGVDLPGHWLSWAVTTFAAACAAAGLALALVTACTTRRQAQSLGSMVVLVISALGGSMVPRYAMPPMLQDLGWITPNAWALDAYQSIFWRGDDLTALITPWAVLLAAALIGLAIAQLLTHRLMWR